jgi:dTDP-4-dehydrorhamnose reductase
MKILVTGANGQVGWALTQQGSSQHEILALDHNGLDITDPIAVQKTVENNKPDVVINAAAYTAVDKAEQEPELAFAVNRDGPRHLATACAHVQIPLVHISTDYVFDGRKTDPYREDDPIAPLGVYGRSKWEGEEVVRQNLPIHIILRVSWVFGDHGHNFVKTMLRLAREREQLRVVADQHGCPTYAGQIAAVLLNLAEQSAPRKRRSGQQTEPVRAHWGTYHYSGAPATTWHGFAEAIIAKARAYETLSVNDVVPITTEDFPTPAVRPANSMLDGSLLKERFDIDPGNWQAGLETMLQALYN